MEASVHRTNQQSCHHKLNSTVIHRLERYIYTNITFFFLLDFKFQIYIKFMRLLFDNNSIGMSCIQGTPILQSISNECHYEFEWPTNVMCPNHVGEFKEKKCELYNSQIKHSLNLQGIFKNGLLTVSFHR